MKCEFAKDSTAAWAVLYLRLPGGRRVKSIQTESKARLAADGSSIRWDAPRGTMKFQATVEK